MSQVYMTAKLNLADGTIIYPQVSLDNIVASISNPTLVSVATTADVSAQMSTKQDTLTEGPGVQILNGSTISFNGTTLDVTTIMETESNGVHLSLDGANVSVVANLAANDSAGVIAGAADGVTLDNGVVKANIGDGLLVEDSQIAIDEATVEQVLQGGTATWTEGAGGWSQSVVLADDKVDTPANLRGALSVGQAVDVSCAPYNNSGSIVYVNDDFLQGFTATMVNGTKVGFYDTTTHRFPKFADGLVYLFIANVSGSGTVTPNGASAVTLSDTPQRIWTKVTAADSGYISASANATMTVTNWRQYEVTALTDEAIAYIASLPDPDQFFRSSTIFQVRDKYLVKQDMVCPWIYTIGMPDNSDLTVAAGLSYKIKYTNDNPHKITVDTIPTDAYGWDTHVQMFIKGTSSIQFQHPLILMDALTPNAGHNLIIKYRNGDALVYVDDTNAGNIVVAATGTTAGTLNYFLQQDPGSGNENYIIFAPATDGLTCDAGTVSVAYNTDILGNGMDKTAISGICTIGYNKVMNLQDLTISGSTINGAGTVNFDNVSLSNVDLSVTVSEYGTVIVPAGSTVTGSGYFLKGKSLIINGTLYKKGAKSHFIDGDGTGVIDGGGSMSDLISLYLSNESYIIKNITVTGGSSSTSGGASWVTDIKDAYFYNCTFQGNTASSASRDFYLKVITGEIVFDGCKFLDEYPIMHTNSCNVLKIVDCTFTAQIRIITTAPSGSTPSYRGKLIFAGTNKINSRICGPSTAASYNYIGCDTYLSAGSVLDFMDYALPVTTAFLTYTSFAEANSLGKYIFVSDDVSVISPGGTTASIDGCRIDGLFVTGMVRNIEDGVVTITGSTANPWKATNVIFASPLDASAASTVKLSGTTFTSGSLISGQPTRIQLPASTTVSLSGNTNAADTKIIQAPIIVVGDDPAAPSGSATVVNAAGTTSTISGIGTYIDKEGDNDFVANNSTNVVPVDNSTTGAKYLGTVLSATTGETGANRFAKIDSGAVAVVDGAVNAVNKQIITHDYEPIIGGTFSLTSATVNEATKTVAIQSGGAISVDDIRGGNDSIIDLNEKLFAKFASRSASISGFTITNGGQSGNGGGVIQFSGSDKQLNISNCSFTNNYTGGTYTLNVIDNEAGTVMITDCYFGSQKNSNRIIKTRAAGTTIIEGSTIYGFVTFVGGPGGSYVLSGYNYFNGSLSASNSNAGTVTLTSGAVLDLTGNATVTPIAPGVGVTFEAGGATVYPSAGSASAYVLGGMTVPQIGNTNVVNLSGGTAIVPVNTQAYASGAIFSSGNVFVSSGGTLTLGTVGLQEIAGESGAVIISSGASVNLTSSIAPGGGITVLTGGCKVNGNTIPAGTYTSIDSNGSATV